MSAGSESLTRNTSQTGAAATAETGLGPVGTTARVLIVEDDAGVRSLLTDILQQEGYDVLAVADGLSALQTLKKLPIQALVTDFNLPDMDGLALLALVTKDYPRTVGIVMTAFGTVDLAVKAMKAGAVDFLSKPFEPVLVALTLRKVLEVQRLRQENVILKHTFLKQPGVQVKAFAPQDMGGEMWSEGSNRTDVNGETSTAAREAFEQGLAEGDRRATERETAKLASQCNLLSHAIRQVEERYDSIAAELEAQTVELAFEIARKVVHECAEEKRDVILTQVRSAIARVRDAVREHALVRIRVHPHDVPIVEELRELLANVFDGPVVLAFEGDASLGRGGCLVQTGTRLVDATLETQLGRLAGAFRSKGHKP